MPSIFSHRVFRIIAPTAITLYLIIWAISSPLSKHLIKPVLLEKGLTLSSDTSITYNPFLSQLSVSDLTLFDSKQQTVLSIDSLIIRVTLLRLLFDKIAVSKFDLNGAYLKVEKTSSQLLIAGIDVNKKNPDGHLEQEQETATESTSPLYQLLLPELILKEVNIELDNDSKSHQINIKQLLLSQVEASLQSQQATLSLQSTIDGTALELLADASVEQGQGEINSQLSINNYPMQKLQRYAGELAELSGSLSLNSSQQITFTPQQFNLHISKAKLSNTDLVMAYQQQFFSLEKFEHNINDLKLSFNQGELTELSGTSQLSLNNADIYYQTSNQKIAHFSQLALNDISFHFNGLPQVKISSLVIDDLYGSKNETKNKSEESNLPALVTLKQLNISDILISEQQLAINKITLDSLQSDVILDTEKVIANLVTLPITSAEQEEVAEITEEIDQEINPKNADFLISLTEFSLQGKNHISLLDNSVEPVKKRQLFIDTLHLGALSNAKGQQEQQTPFTLIGRSNKYAHFNFNGFTKPFAQKPTHHLQGFLKELSLPTLSRYMKKAMQMELKSGQLNTDIDMTLTGEQLDGSIVLLIKGLETAIADSDEAGALIDQGALPFNLALGMLKDGRGDIELDVPLSGSTSDPSFGVSSIVSLITQKAIWMATQDYLMTTFVPYANIVSVAMTVGEFALKLRFDDLIYQEKQIAPNEQQQAYLQAFIALMQDKEDTRVNICGISTPADINLLAGSQITDKKQIRQLKDIAEQREEVFKEYMIKHGNIASSRLLLCTPKIDSSDDAQPRIELSV